jgi:aspartyl-tRNA(Asn)/glutamyl-tRNA(Gln) amidotransferase subunit B
MEEIELSGKATSTLVNEPKFMLLLQEVKDLNASNALIKIAANLLAGEAMRAVNELDFDWSNFKLDAARLLTLAKMLSNGELNSGGGKEVLLEIMQSVEQPEAVAKAKSLIQDNDLDSLAAIVDEVIKVNVSVVQQYKNGDVKVMGFLVGQIMKMSGGKANPKSASEILRDKLKS